MPLTAQNVNTTRTPASQQSQSQSQSSSQTNNATSKPPTPSNSTAGQHQQHQRSSFGGFAPPHPHSHPPHPHMPPSSAPASVAGRQSLQPSFVGVGAGAGPMVSHHNYSPTRPGLIYTAVYSGVSVYEMNVQGIAVMRRRSDSWLNATQILKVAGVDKGKRTKVLEKEILSGEHEKVQGGYGRYQGTWINYARGRDFCRAYGVEELLRPLLEYDMGQDGAQPGNGSIETPTKEQAMAAQRKKMMYGSDGAAGATVGGPSGRPPAPTPNGTFFKNISATALNAVNAINRARFDPPAGAGAGAGAGSRPGSGHHDRPSSSSATLQPQQRSSLNPSSGNNGNNSNNNNGSSQESQFQLGQSSQQSMQSMHTDTSFGAGETTANGQSDPFASSSQGAGTAATAPYFVKPGRPYSGPDDGPPRKRARPSSGSLDHRNDANMFARGSAPHRLAPNETEPFPAYQISAAATGPPGGGVGGGGGSSQGQLQLQLQQQQQLNLHGPHPLPPLAPPQAAAGREKQQFLASLFLDPNREDLSDLPSLESFTQEDMDIPIDGTAHTALHWAATLAKPELLRALIARGANIFRVNLGGETALMRAALTTNNFGQNSFPELLELLGPTIELRDGRGRTVLHHIAVSSAIRGRGAACRYYLDSLLEFVVRQGSVSNSVANSFNADGSTGSQQQQQKQPQQQQQQQPPKYRPIGLARFMSEIVNAQDISGDTALNLAARINNRSIIQQLLEVGANPSIPNRGGLKPLDFGIGEEDNIAVANGNGNGGAMDNGATEPGSQGQQQPQQAQGWSSQNTAVASSSTQRTPMEKVGDMSKDLMSSITTLITDTESSFKSELQAKQSLIDQAQKNLREATSELAREKRSVTDLDTRKKERSQLSTKITNYRRSNEIKHAQLTSTGPAPTTGADVRLGDADTGLTIDVTALQTAVSAASSSSSAAAAAVAAAASSPTKSKTPGSGSNPSSQQSNPAESRKRKKNDSNSPTSPVGADPTDISNRQALQTQALSPPPLSQTLAQTLAALPPADILEARVRAYRLQNAALRETRAELGGRSAALERKLKRLVALGARTAESRVDDEVRRLGKAVESERNAPENVDEGRVREFLTRVEEAGGLMTASLSAAAAAAAAAAATGNNGIATKNAGANAESNLVDKAGLAGSKAVAGAGTGGPAERGLGVGGMGMPIGVGS